MPFATLTWTSTSLRTVACAGASTVLSELLVGIKAAIDNDSVHWMTSDYSLANGTLEIKRKGTPTGEQATMRILFFGGQIPAAGALLTGATAANTNLYCAMSVDANTTGPTTSYAVGAPYGSKYVLGQIVCINSALQLADSPKVSLVESEDALAVSLNDINTMATCIVGRVIEEAAGSQLMWGVFSMCIATTNITNADNIINTSSTSPITGNNTAGVTPAGSMWNTTLAACRRCGRAISPGGGSGPILGTSAAPSTLMIVPLMESQNIAAPGTQNFLGYLRQIRFGPQAQHLQTLRNSAGVAQAIHFGPPNGVTGYGAWFDQVA